MAKTDQELVQKAIRLKEIDDTIKQLNEEKAGLRQAMLDKMDTLAVTEMSIPAAGVLFKKIEETKYHYDEEHVAEILQEDVFRACCSFDKAKADDLLKDYPALVNAKIIDKKTSFIKMFKLGPIKEAK